MELIDPPWIEELEKLKKKGVKFLTIREIAQISGVSPWTIRRLVRSGELDAIKLRSQWVVYIDAFIEFTIKRYNLNLED